MYNDLLLDRLVIAPPGAGYRCFTPIMLRVSASH